MKTLILACATFLAAIGGAGAATSTQMTGFKIGDAPPALAPMAWIKGEPVATFRPGHVYVVEFFATWCGSSRQAMPRLSKLARERAAELTVIGVAIREAERSQPTVAAVTEFVRQRGEDMSYIVAMDDPENKTLYRTWMAASGMHGVPAAFIIGRDGKLAYVGYMMDEQAAYTFETAVAQALAGTSDVAAARALQADVNRQTAERLREMELLKPIRDARSRGDYRAAVLEADKIIAGQPEFAAQAFTGKLAAMLHIDERKALAFAHEQAQNISMRAALDARQDRTFWELVGRVIAQEKNLSKSTYQEAAVYLRNVAESDDIVDQVLLAKLYSLTGNLDRAIAAQGKAIAAARRTKDIPSESIARLEATLAAYERQRLQE